MTPKQEAEEIFKEYWLYLRANLMHDEEAMEDAKVCALIAVKKIRNNLPLISEIQQFWEEVKQEILKL